jgi:uncharacterized protein (DUF58 family)
MPRQAPERPAIPRVLDPAVLAAIADLEFVARVTIDGTVSGLHRSPFHGYSAEFSQYRQYRPGDDLKYVDWKLFARTDRFFTKQYRETTNLAAQVAIDASASMGYAGRAGITKFDYARLLAAALSHLLSTQGDAVGLVAFADRVHEFVGARAGQAHLRGLLVRLSRLAPSGGTAATAAVRRAIDLLGRRGILIVVSDLYDEDAAIERELRRAARIGHEIAIFHVLTREEVEYPLTADAELEDLETGDRTLAGAAARERYRQSFAAFLARWRARCEAAGIDYTLALTDMPLDLALRGYLLRRAGAARR